MRKLNYVILALAVFVGLNGCKKDDPQLGEPPTAADAAFTFNPTAANPNIVEFTANNPNLNASWDLGNGTTASGSTVTGTYPNAGTYTVTLTVFNSGGSASSSQDVVIANDDPSLLNNPLYTMLTGGSAGPGFKTWVIDSVSMAHFGVGPDPVGAGGDYPEWWAAGPNDKGGVGLYDDRYTFYLNNFQYDMMVDGEVYVHNELASDFPGSYENLTDYTAPYTDQTGETWTLTEGADTTLSVSGSSFIAMWTGVRDYRVINVSDTALWLQYKHHSGGLHWYVRLIPEGFVSGGGGGGGTTTYSLPLDFESTQPTFTTFGNSTYGIIANPDASGINTSANVLETVHGNETWAGLYVDLTDPLDFSAASNIVLKVWAPVADTFRVKIESTANPNDFAELDAIVPAANSWQEISVDFSGATSGLYDRLVLFPGWGVANAGTFYLDDIKQQ